MIRANELRIGNWVVRDGITDQWNEGDFIRYHHSVEPLPLTPSLIEKCGFAKTETMLGRLVQFSLIDYRRGNMVINTNEKWDLIEVEYCRLDIEERTHIAVLKYLHQLQNLYFALTGNELEVNLKENTGSI